MTTPSPPPAAPRTRSILVPLLALAAVMGALVAGGALARHLGWGLVARIAAGELAVLAAMVPFAVLDRVGLRTLGLRGGWKGIDFAYVPAQLFGHFVVSGALGAYLAFRGILREEDVGAVGVLKSLAAQPAGEVLLGALVIAGLAALCEEVAFRGYLIPRLEAAGLPGPAAAVLSAVAFGALHIPGYGVLASLPKVLSFGLPVSFYFLWRRSLWPVMAAHFLVDFAGLALMLVLSRLAGSVGL